MGKHRAVVIGAGRIGAGYQWGDLAYTHAGAYQALKDRVELVGFIEPNEERAQSAKLKWHVPVYEDIPTGLMALRPDIVSVCVQPADQWNVLKLIEGVKGIWCEKPYVSPKPEGNTPIQVNYLRRGDFRHQRIAASDTKDLMLSVVAKDDIHTRCHFEDLAKWWRVPLVYMPIPDGPCSYILGKNAFEFESFEAGGVNGGECMRNMLGNLLDHIEGKAALWSPPI